ncbi:MAG: flagellar assembly protein FliH [Candidatus Accumulibacter sp. 66-26]|nr:MAG: flagellar assembly protein FliH [Candidatus Accumulibacter sp. 66-26]
MTGFIPKEKLTAYQRWELAAFDEEAQAAAEPEPPPPPPEPEPEPPPPEPEPELPPVVLPTAEDIERMHAEAHEAGYSAGYEEGLGQGRAEAQRIDALLGDLQGALHEIDQDVAEQLLAVAVEIAGQVLRQSLEIKPELILPVVREAVAALPLYHGHPALRIHPDDAALIRSQLGEQLSHNNWRIIEDATLTPGGCRVELGASTIDATLETRWRRVIEAIGISQEWLDGRP